MIRERLQKVEPTRDDCQALLNSSGLFHGDVLCYKTRTVFGVIITVEIPSNVYMPEEDLPQKFRGFYIEYKDGSQMYKEREWW